MNQPIYTKELRGRWYLSVDRDHRTVTETCVIFGISRETYHKWYRHDHGLTPNRYQPRQPQPNLKLTSAVQQLIEQEKGLTNYGPLKMKLLLKRRINLDVSTTVIYRFYKKKGLVRRVQLTPRGNTWYS